MSDETKSARVELRGAAMGYGGALVFEDLSLALPLGKVTALCGPNGCGKSTALKAMRGTLPLTAGDALLQDRPLRDWSAKSLAREIAILGQSPSAPEDMRVRDLVALGRYSHRAAFAPLSDQDRAAISGALQVTNLSDLAERPLGALSGGQLQRAWLAMVVCQESPTLFLDEPTNHLDLSHALSVLDMVRRFVTEAGKTVAIVLHDLNMAAAVADHVIFFRDGKIHAEGPPDAVMTEALLAEVFDIACTVLRHPSRDLPLIVPLASNLKQ